MANHNMDDMRAVVTRAEAKASGSSRYFSGKPCPHGHNADRYTINATCVVCFGERDRALKAKKAARELARKREWKTRNPEKVREQSRQWYDKNRAKVAERKRKWLSSQSRAGALIGLAIFSCFAGRVIRQKARATPLSSCS